MHETSNQKIASPSCAFMSYIVICTLDLCPPGSFHAPNRGVVIVVFSTVSDSQTKIED